MEKYIIHKTQKIVSALYLVTDLIKDNDPIKWDIREEGISLVSSSTMIGTTFPAERENASKSFIISSQKIISFLNIGKVSGIVSDMNSNILIQELESVTDHVKKEIKEVPLKGYILSDSFFSTESPVKDNIGHNDFSYFDKNTESKEVIKKTLTSTISRSDMIIDLLKKDSNLSIKDFAKVIKNCSEKTIQRELLELVKKGLVKRQGERRWSTYSLV